MTSVLTIVIDRNYSYMRALYQRTDLARPFRYWLWTEVTKEGHWGI